MAEVKATLVVNFQAGGESDRDGLLLLELDDREDGLNGGNTQFRPGDSAYYLLYIGSNVTLTAHKTTRGAINRVGAGTRQVEEVLNVTDSKEVSLRYPVAGGLTLSWLGQSFDTNGAAKSISISLATQNKISLSEPAFGQIKAVYTAAFEVWRLSNVPLTAESAMVIAVGTIA